jgi:hypothetical protein
MLFLMFLFSLSAYSQYAAEVKGFIVDSETQEPLVGVAVILANQQLSTITGLNGEFVFKNVKIGDDRLSVSAQSVKPAEFPVTVLSGQVINLGNFEVETIQTESDKTLAFVEGSTHVMNLDELDLDADSDVSTQGISSLILLSNDPYSKLTSYRFSQVRFRARGYANRYEQTLLSGVEFNDQIRGQFNYSMIGAMNDMTRNGDVLNYMQPGSFTFGSIGGSQNISLRAGNYAKGGKVSLSYTDGNYYARAMASYSTGLMDNGWAFSALAGGRYADEGYVEGTFYNNASYFLAAEKQWDDGKHSFSFTTFGSPVQRGQAAASVMEAYNLVSDYFYNPNWGWYDGKKRNARVVTAYDPTAILSYVYTPDKDTRWTTGLGVHYNRYGGTAINWFENNADPRPDYYRNLPSFQATGSMRFLTSFSTSDLMKYMLSNPSLNNTNKGILNKYALSYTNWMSRDPKTAQIDWDALYFANLNGGDAASYVVEERRNDLLEFSLNSTFEKKLADNIQFVGGIGLRSTAGMSFTTVNDLLGANYVIDIDKYGNRDFPGNKDALQKDLNHPNRKVYEGDRYGYDYTIQAYNGNVWLQNQHRYDHIDFYYGLKLAYTSFYRDGKMRNGYHPDDSYGKGETHSFLTPTGKAGFTYKIDGRNFIVGNVSYGLQAPLPYDAYVAPRVWDEAVPDLKSEKIFSADLGYLFSFPNLTGKISVFQTNFYDQIDKITYFSDVNNAYLHHVMYNMDKVHHGVELGVIYTTPLDGLKLSFGGTVSEYYYANNPDGQMVAENSKAAYTGETVYLKNFYVGSTPQVAGTFGADYFYKYWFLGAYLNGFARSYIDPEPTRRVQSAIGFTEYGEQNYLDRVKEYVAQQSLKGGMTLDLSIGKIFYLKNGHSLNTNFSFNNVLNYKHLQTGGYEQGRIDTDDYRLSKFPSKFYYMQGFNCYLNANYKF